MARTAVRADPEAGLIQAWRTNNAVNIDLVRQMPPKVFDAAIPGVPRRTIRHVAAHLHNSRCSWIKTLGSEHGIAAPSRVDHRRVSRADLPRALERSGAGIEAVLRLGLANGGVVPPSKRYVWRNLPLDVWHVLTYFVAHEAHHRGQIVMAARQLDLRLPRTITDGLWQWSRIVRQR
jgi:uncharacterized damage-inducible protein DinB